MTEYGIIGCGYCGSIHAQSISQLPDARLAAVYDIDPDRAQQMARRWGARAAASMSELCADPAVDAVLVATPNHGHFAPALAALQQGRHVLCEKPVTLDLVETFWLTDLAKRQNRVLFAGHVTNFIPGVQQAADYLAEGRIGELLVIQALHTDWAGPQPQVGWKQKKELSGGHLYHHMHEVDLICRFGGLPRRVFAQGKNLAHHGPGFGDEEDADMLLMQLEGGGFASLTIGSAFHMGQHSLLLQGTRGGIRLDFKHAYGLLQAGGETVRFGLHQTPEQDNERREGYLRTAADAGAGFGRPGMQTSSWMQSIFAEELQAFHSLIRQGAADPGTQRLADGSAAVECALVLDAASRSMACMQAVDVERKER